MKVRYQVPSLCEAQVVDVTDRIFNNLELDATWEQGDNTVEVNDPRSPKAIARAFLRAANDVCQECPLFVKHVCNGAGATAMMREGSDKMSINQYAKLIDPRNN